MGHLFALILPLSLGAAVSPFLLIATMLTLSQRDQPKAKVWLLTLGSFVALAIFEALVLAIGSHIDAKKHPHPLEEAVVGFSLVILFAALIARQILRRHEQSQNGLLDRIDRASLRSFFVIGIILMAWNFSTLLLVFPALRIITHADVSSLGAVLGVAFVTLFAMLPALLPATLVTVLGSHAGSVLEPLNRFVTTYTLQLMIGLEAIFAIYFFVKGLKGALAL